MTKKYYGILSVVLALCVAAIFAFYFLFNCKVTFYIYEGQKVTINQKRGDLVIPIGDPERDGYSFVGWYEDAQGNEAFDFETTKVYYSETIYAKWDKIYNVSYYVDSVLYDVDQLIEGEELFTLPTVSKEGYIFVGWYDGVISTSSKVTYILDIDKNINLFARFSLIE